MFVPVLFCRRYRKFPAGIGLAAGLMLFAQGCSGPVKPAEDAAPLVGVVTVKPAPQAAGDRAGYIAVVKGDQETDLSFKLGGIVDLIGPVKGKDWDQGAPVAKGGLLARLSQDDVLSQLKAAQARAELDRAEYERVKSLYENKAVATQDLERQDAARKASEAALAQAKQAVADSALAAPFDGVVLMRFIRAGETIAAGQAVLRIANLANVSVEVGVPDSALPGIQVGSSHRITIAALGDRTLEGKVAEVGVAARPEDGLFKIVLKLPNPQGTIKPGMTANVIFNQPSAVAVAEPLLVPLSALVADDRDQLSVFVVDSAGGKVRRQAVKTGDIVKSSLVIREGLKAGEVVVVSGAANLHDGAAVRIQAQKSE
jgi:membrane fusion protein (multidrug efflux system)